MTTEEIAERLIKVEERSKSNTHQISELKPVVNEIYALSKTTAAMAANLNHINDNLSDIKDKVDVLEKTPAEDHKYYKRLAAGCVITTVIGLIIGALFALFIK